MPKARGFLGVGMITLITLTTLITLITLISPLNDGKGGVVRVISANLR